jgi:spermidine/putrescine transport system permease protein
MKKLRQLSGALPGGAYFALFLLIPLIYIAVISFCTKGESWGVEYKFTFDNYEKFLDPTYVKIFGRSFGIAILSTISTLVIGFPFAYALIHLSRRAKNIALVALILPFMVSAMVRIYGWVIILQSKGLINTSLIKLGIIDEPLKILYTNAATLIGTVYTLLPFVVLPIYNSLEKIDFGLNEASADLGASPWKTFRSVTLRESLPGIFYGSLMVFVPSIGLFYISDLLGGANTMLLGNLIHNQFTQARNWPFGAALTVIMAILAIILISMYKKIFGTKKMEMFI